MLISGLIHVRQWQIYVYVCTCALSLRSCLTLCDPTDCSPPASSVHGILQAKILECVALLSSRVSSWPRDRTCVSCIAGGFFTAEPLGKQYIYICYIFFNHSSVDGQLDDCFHVFSLRVCVCVCVCISCSVMSNSLRLHELCPAKLLCPWNSPGKNTGVGGHSLLQGIFNF